MAIGGSGGSNLPPGCTSADIERAFGERPDILEAFKAAHKGKLTSLQEEQLCHPDLYEDASIADLVEKFFAWAHSIGKNDAREDDGQYLSYLEDKKIFPVLFKAENALKAAEDILMLSRLAEKADFSAPASMTYLP